MQDQNQPERYPDHGHNTYSYAKRSKTKQVIGAVALLASSFIIGRFTALEGPATATVMQATTEAAKNYAEATQTAQIRANIIADSVNKTIDNVGSFSTANVLNGIIINNELPDQSNGNTGYTYSYRDAYLLSDINYSSLDSADKFLDGKWIGVTSNDSSGRIIISPMIFNPNTMSFKANKTGGSPVINALLQATRVNFVPGPAAYEAFAFDSVSHQSLINDDGTQFEAGFVTRIS